MTRYIVEYNNSGFDKYLRHYRTDSYYDALRWYECMKFQYHYVRLRYDTMYEDDILEEYIKED